MIENLQALLSGLAGGLGFIVATAATVNVLWMPADVELSNGQALRILAQVAIAALLLRIAGLI